jgi:hypothetical protein
MTPQQIQDQKLIILQEMTEHALSILTLIQQFKELENQLEANKTI